jgi:hypothetical protein
MATVQVESLRWHTYDGVERPEGTVYEADEQFLETLEAIGMARRSAPTAAPPATPPPPRKPIR